MTENVKIMLSEVLDNVIQTYHSKISRDAIETLLKIHRNILRNKDELKFRQIKLENPTFHRKIWCEDLLRHFMWIAGWRAIRGVLVFNSDEKLLNIIECLVDHRAVVPVEEEWESSTKYDRPSEDQLDKELRSKAAIEREKELAEYYKDKKYRDELAQKVKMEIKEDRMRMRRGQYYVPPAFGILQPVRSNRLCKRC